MKLSIIVVWLMSMTTIEANTQVCPKIYAMDGKIKIQPQSNCIIKTEGIQINNTEEIVPGWWYGFIEYECGECRGQFLSEFECIECGIYCEKNDMHVKCRSFWFPTICGTLLGICTYILSVLTITKVGKTMLIKIRTNMDIWNNTRKEGKMEKFKSKLNKIKNLENIKNEKESIELEIVNSTEPDCLKIKNSEETEKIPSDFEIRDALITLQAFDKSEEFKNLSEFGNLEVIKTVLKDDKQMIEKLEKTRTKDNIHQYAIAAAIGTLLLLSGPVKACENTLLLSALGEVCDYNSCKPMSAYSFTMNLNSQICFRLNDGNLMKIQFFKSTEDVEYYPVYNTATFNVQTSYQWQCKNYFSSCWIGEKCRIGYQHENFKLTKNIENFDCFMDTLGCDTYCAHQTSCTWVHWWLLPSANQYPILKQVRTFWKIKMRITFQNITREIDLDSNKIQNIINTGEFYEMNEIPITVNSYISEKNFHENFLIKIKENYYEINAAEKNFPVIGLLGEYQIALDEKSKTYPEHEVNCRVLSCEPVCKVPKQALERFLEGNFSQSRIETKVLEYPDKKVIIQNRKKASINIVLGNIDIANLHIAPANCKLQIVGKYGCTGCNNIPYIVLKSENILEKGSMKYLSNCTFIEKLIGCTTELQQFRLKNREEKCYIHIPITNQTLNFELKYEFVGGMTRYNAEFSTQDKKFVDTALAVMYNTNFLQSIKMTFLVGTVATLVLTISSKLFRVYYLTKVAKKIEETN